MKREKKNITFTKNLGFTLVELIIVITILAILATIAFISFKNYSGNARDGNRLATLKNIEKGLSIYQAKTGYIPLPENSIAVLSSGVTLGYQGDFSEQIANMISFSNTPIDIKDKTPFIYSVNQAKTLFQVGGFLEQQPITFFPQTYANTRDYSKRYFQSFGTPLGILFVNNGSEKNIPLHFLREQASFTGIDIKTFTGVLENGTDVGELKVVFNNTATNNIVGTGSSLVVLENTYTQQPSSSPSSPSPSPNMQILMTSCPVGWVNKGQFRAKIGNESVTTLLGENEQTYSVCEGNTLNTNSEIVMTSCPVGWVNKGQFRVKLGRESVTTLLGENEQIYSSCEGSSLNTNSEIVMISCPVGWANKGQFRSESGRDSVTTLLGENEQVYHLCQKTNLYYVKNLIFIKLSFFISL